MTRKTTNLKRRNKRWPGLKSAAETLGVSYGHLRLCASGQRESKSLLSRFHALKSRQGADPAEEISRPENGRK